MPFLPPAPPSVRSRSLGDPLAAGEVVPPPQGSTLQQPLPAPPPSVTKKPTIWDKDHISETLLGIGQAFLSNQNFGEGLGAAAGVMSRGQQALRDDAKRTVTYGGPNNQFEISADKNGNRSVRLVPEFAKAAQDERDAKARPSWKDMEDRKARLVYQVGKLPQGQRSAAYADIIANPQRYGISPDGMPTEWSDTYGTVAGNSGMTVMQDRGADRSDLLAGEKIKNDGARTQQGADRLDLARTKDARAALKASAPPSVRNGGGAKPAKGYSIIRSRSEFNALPVGSKFIAPDGSKRIKQ